MFKKLLLVLFLSLQNILFSLPIHDAAKVSDFNKMLADMANKNEIDENGDRPIHSAARNLQIGAIDYLLQNGVSINSTNTTGTTALHFIASLGKESDALFLLNRDAAVNIADKLDFSTALHVAVQYQNIDVLKALLNYNFTNGKKLNINAQNKYGLTALHNAVQKHNYPIVCLLLNAGIDRNIQDYENKTAFLYALEMRASGYNMNSIINAIDPNYLPYEQQYWAQQNQQFYNPEQTLEVQPKNEKNSTIRIELIEDEQDINSKKIGQEQKEQEKVLDVTLSESNVEDVIVNIGPREPKSKPVSEFEKYDANTKFTFQGKPNAEIEKLKKEKQLEIWERYLATQPKIKSKKPFVSTEAEIAAKIKAENKRLRKDILEYTDENIAEIKENQNISSESSNDSDESNNSIQVKDVIQEKPENIKSEKISKHQLKKQRLLLNKKKKVTKLNQPKKQIQNDQQSEQELTQIAEPSEAQEDSIDLENNLLQDQAILPKRNKSGNTELHTAIEKNEEISADLMTYENVATPNNEGNFALHFAVMHKNFEICRDIIAAGADIDATNLSGYTALHYAINKNLNSITNLLLGSGANVNILNDKTKNKLNVMANSSDIEIFEHLNPYKTEIKEEKKQKENFASSPKLIEESKEQELIIDKNQNNGEQYSSSFAQIAAMVKKVENQINEEVEYKKFIENVMNGKLSLVKQAIAKNPHWLKKEDTNGIIVLHCAVIGFLKKYTKDLSVIKYLTEKDPTTIFKGDKINGITPMDLSILHNNIKIFEYFLNWLVKLKIKNSKELLQRFVRVCQKEIAESPKHQHIKTMLKLLNNELNVSSDQNPSEYIGKDKEELGILLKFYLEAYSMFKQESMVVEIKKVIEAGADLSYKNANNATLLHIFAYLDNIDLLAAVLKRREIDITAQDNLGNNVLHYSASKGSVRGVALLLALNSNLINVVNNDGDTPLHLATKSKKIVEMLINSGTNTNIKNNKKLTPLLTSIDLGHKPSMIYFINHIFYTLKISPYIVMKDIDEALENDHEGKLKNLGKCHEFMHKFTLDNKPDPNDYYLIEYDAPEPKIVFDSRQITEKATLMTLADLAKTQ